MISLLLLSCYYFSFAPGCVVSIFGGNQHSPDQGCSAESCRSGVFTGEDEHMSLHPTILCHKSFHARMDTIKDRNGMYLIEAEDINKRWQKYTKQCKNDLNYPDNHDGVITLLESNILECKIKWALGSITMNKDSGDHGIPLVELFQILKGDAVKGLHSICQQI